MKLKETKEDKEKRLSLEEFKSNLDSTVELVRDGFLPVGARFGIGELSGTPSIDMVTHQVETVDAWLAANEKDKSDFLRNMIIELGLVPENLTRERSERTYIEKGVRNEESEGGADVMVFKTQYPQLELHVLDYRNKDVGRRYNLVVAEG